MSDLLDTGATKGADAYAVAYAGAYLVVGDGTTAQDEELTGLTGANQAEAAVEQVTVTGNVITFVATFEPADAAFNWAEVGVKDAPGEDGVFLFRKLTPSLGIKPNNVRRRITIDFELRAQDI